MQFSVTNDGCEFGILHLFNSIGFCQMGKKHTRSAMRGLSNVHVFVTRLARFRKMVRQRLSFQSVVAVTLKVISLEREPPYSPSGF